MNVTPVTTICHQDTCWSNVILIIIISRHLSLLYGSRILQSAPQVKICSQALKTKATYGDLNAVCDRRQARADPLLFTKRPATLKCAGIALLLKGTTTSRNYPNHSMPFTHCDVCTFWSQ